MTVDPDRTADVIERVLGVRHDASDLSIYRQENTASPWRLVRDIEYMLMCLARYARQDIEYLEEQELTRIFTWMDILNELIAAESGKKTTTLPSGDNDHL